jgi:hypothetical protein
MIDHSQFKVLSTHSSVHQCFELVIGRFREPPAPTHPFPRSMLVRSGQGQFRLVAASVLGTSLSEIAMIHGSANHLSELLHNLGRKEHPPELPKEPGGRPQA